MALSNDKQYVLLNSKANSTRVEANKLLSAVTLARKKYGESSTQYKEAKIKYNKADSVADVAEEARIKRRDELQKPKEKKAAPKTTTDKDILLYQLGLAKDAGNTAEIKRIEEKLKPTTAGSTSSSKVSDADQVKAMMDSASITLNGSQYQVNVSSPNEADPEGKPQVLPKSIYYEPTGARMSGNRPISGSDSGVRFGDSDAVRDDYQKQLLKQYGSKQALIDKLFKGGFLPTNKFAANQMSKAIIKGLEDAVAEYTLKQVDDYKNNNVKEFESMDAFLTSGKRSGFGKSLTRTTKTATVYDATEATKIIKRLYQAAQGRDPNEKELKELIPMLQDFQKKNPQVNKSTDNEEGTFTSTSIKTGGDPEEFLVDKLSEKNETKARSILGYYDAFKSTIGVQ